MPRLLLAAVLAAGTSCAPAREGVGPCRALSWRLVEVEAPGGKQLVLEAYDPGPPAIEIRFLGGDPAVGEPAEAEIRLPGSVGVHVVEVVPTRPEVRVLGPAVLQIRDEGPVRVRFTSDVAGKGGVKVLVKE